MKMIKDYTGKEFEDLTDDQIKTLIDWECADAGAPLLPPFPNEPVKPNQKPDMVLYSIGGHEVSTREDALIIMDALSKVQLWDTNYVGSDYNNRRAIKKNVGEYDSEGNIRNVTAYSPEMWEKVKQEYEVYSSQKKIYDEEKKEYDSAEKSRREISEYVWEMASAARAFKNKRESLKKNLSDYIALAEGDEETGIRFFQKAYPGYWEYLKISKNNQVTDQWFSHSDLSTYGEIEEAA